MNRPERPPSSRPSHVDQSAAIPIREPAAEVTAALLDAVEFASEAELLDRLRMAIDTARFTARLRPGDRLPSIRDIAQRSGLNHKVVRRCIRTLAREGRAEVRPRSGLYVPAEREPADDGTPAFLADALAAARRHGFSPLDLSRALARPYLQGPLQALCVAPPSPWRTRACAELRDGFGMEAKGVTFGELAPRAASLLAAADVVVTSPFDAAALRRHLTETGSTAALVVATLPEDVRSFAAAPPFGDATTRAIGRAVLGCRPAVESPQPRQPRQQRRRQSAPALRRELHRPLRLSIRTLPN